MTRQPIKVNIERDRVSLVREVEDGKLENTYRLIIQNASEHDHVYLIRAEGLPNMQLIGKDSIELASTEINNLSVRVQVPPEHAKVGSHEIRFIVTAKDDPNQTVTEKATFIGK